MNVPLQCTKCRAVLPLAAYNASKPVPCPACGREHLALVFPAFLTRAEGVRADGVADDSEAGCFYHPGKKAMLACDSCGRFVCALCEVELSGRHLCPQCLDSGKKKGKLSSLETKRTLYDSIALGLTLYPMLVFYITFLTAPMALYYLFRYRNAPGSLVSQSRSTWYAALIIALAQIAGWCVLVIALKGAKHGH